MTKINSIPPNIINTPFAKSKAEEPATKTATDEKTEVPASVTASVVLSQYKATASSPKIYPNGTTIEPIEFPPNDYKKLNILELYNEYPYYNCSEHMFSEEANPTELPLINSEIDDEVIYVSNLDMPYGTIAGTSTLDKTLYTDSLRVCAAVAVVDKAHNTQSLIHVFPGYNKETNQNIIEHILSASKPEDLEISVVPGYAPDTAQTLEFIFDTLKNMVPNNTPKLYNFHNNLYIRNCALLLHDGKLSCCDKNNVKNKKTNPPENITYSKYEEIKYVKAQDIENKLKSAEFPEIIIKPMLRIWAVENNLKMKYDDNNNVIFSDKDDKVVRKIVTEYPTNTYVKYEDRYFYDNNDNLKAILHKERGKEAKYIEDIR